MKSFEDEVIELLKVFAEDNRYLWKTSIGIKELIRARLDSCETQEISIGTTKPEWGDAILVSDLHRAFGIEGK